MNFLAKTLEQYALNHPDKPKPGTNKPMSEQGVYVLL